MNNMKRRVALLAGASVSVLGIARPAYAATTPGISHVVTGANASDTIDITLTGENKTFGETASGMASVDARVLSGSGDIFQSLQETAATGNATARIDNLGSAKIRAVANAAGATHETARASISGGVEQVAAGPGTSLSQLVNSGNLAIEGTASASGSDAEANANGRGVEHGAIGAGSNSVSLSNLAGASLDIGISADAAGTNQAQAIASIKGIDEEAENGKAAQVSFNNDGSASVLAAVKSLATVGIGRASATLEGVAQRATAQTAASVDLANNGSLSLIAKANAHGTSALAHALERSGISQVAEVESAGDALTSLVNTGLISASALAKATATSAGRNANAVASERTAINQSAIAKSGDATVTLSNSGGIAVGASAQAFAGGSARAVASLSTALAQEALSSLGNAKALLTNDGTIGVNVGANANGLAANVLSRGFGIFQSATAASAQAAAALVNHGTVSLKVRAQGTGQSFASAEAVGEDLLSQRAGANGNSTVFLDNTGAMTAHVSAFGAAETANAIAVGNFSIFQSAEATNGNALAMLTNQASGASGAGTIGLSLSATAIGGMSANAIAQGSRDIFQSVGGGKNGAALASLPDLASLQNLGTMSVSAVARAKQGGGGAAPVTGSANAIAELSRVLEQDLSSAGGASLAGTLTNSGKINIAASGLATGASANAKANVVDAVRQLASATNGGNVSLDLENSGTFEIQALASANGNGLADARARSVGISQSAIVSGTGQVAAKFDNAGLLLLLTQANANTLAGKANASASLTGILENERNGVATLDNGATLTIAAAATAHVAGGTAGTAAASADVHAVTQDIVGKNATVQNDGGLTIDGVANANGPDLTLATARVDGIEQIVDGTGAFVTNAGTLGIAATAHAKGGTGAEAAATISHALKQDVTGAGTVSMSFDNSGTFHVAADADALSAVTTAFAQAAVEGAISQSAEGSVSLAKIVNGGQVGIAAQARATGVTAASGFATATGIRQRTSQGAASLVNNGFIAVDATASAHAAGASSASARGEVQLSALAQHVNGADATLDNLGTFQIAGIAKATGVASANGEALVAGIVQTATGKAASAVNAGTLSIAGLAVANAGSQAFAAANVPNGILQQVSSSGAATAGLDNSGSLSVTASAHGVAQLGRAEAEAHVEAAVSQEAQSPGALTKIVNNGKLNVLSLGVATGPSAASAFATANGAKQSVTNGTATLANAGIVAVQGTANAVAKSGPGSALAISNGARSSASKIVFDNSGTFSTISNAKSVGGKDGIARAEANGFEAVSPGGELTLDVANSGSLVVGASAVSPGAAFAQALGGAITTDNPAGTSTAPVTVVGRIDNKGSIKVSANAAGGTSTRIVGAGAAAHPVVAANSKAQATGLFVAAANDGTTLNNSGLIAVDAITANGDKITDPAELASAAASAVGVLVQAAGSAPQPAATFTLNNSGNILVRVSGDGGQTFRRGTAIDVRGGPASSVINLLGGGNIVGDINVRSGDLINVAQGLTTFNGIVNSSCAGVDPTSASSCGVGALNISSTGNLLLVNPPLSVPAGKETPASVFVDKFSVASGGTLTLNLDATTGGTQPPGTYSKIITNSASLAGKLLVNIKLPGGLLADNYFWDNVIDANSLSGTFDSCSANGSGSFLVSFKCIYDNANNVDLSLARTAFNQVPGLTRNEASAAGGIEALYSPTLTGPFGTLVGQLFKASNASAYAAALNELTGAAYAGYLQSFSSLGVNYDNVLDRASECDAPVHFGSILECRATKVRLWGQVDYQYRKADGDVELSGYRADRHAFLAGIDAAVAPAVVAGMSIGKVDNDVDYRNFFGTIDSSGYQAGLYAVYDRGTFFLKAIGTYNWFNGRAHRSVDWGALDPALGFEGTIDSHPDVDMYTLGLHGGVRLKTSATSVLTPYVSYDYTHAELGSFTETGLAGANLTVFGGQEKHNWLTGGIKWTAAVGAIVPAIDFGYRHMFGERRGAFDAAFLGDKAAAFNIVSASQKADAVLAGLSLGGTVGRVDLRIAYEGAFNSSYREHSGMLKAVLPLGGDPRRVAPAAVAYPPAPPPSPVAPATQTCSDGTTILATDTCPMLPPPPPAPPPVTQGERG